jgi:hypothetical protein
MFNWINKAWEQIRFNRAHLEPGGVSPTEREGFFHPVNPVRRGKALGLEVDCTSIPTPTDPLWQGAAARP